MSNRNFSTDEDFIDGEDDEDAIVVDNSTPTCFTITEQKYDEE